jgi:hypothetical protein
MKQLIIYIFIAVLISCQNNKNDIKESTRLSNESKLLLQIGNLTEAETVIEKSILLDSNTIAADNKRS